MGTDLDDARCRMETGMDRIDKLMSGMRIIMESSDWRDEDDISNFDDIEGAYWVFMDAIQKEIDSMSETLSWVHHGAKHRKDFEVRAAMRQDKENLVLQIQNLTEE